jgi:hypothetical protein
MSCGGDLGQGAARAQQHAANPSPLEAARRGGDHRFEDF